jgi:hypothetical protein
MMRLAVMAMVTIMSGSAQVLITNSGSTNRAGVNITIEASGPAVIEDRHGNKTQMNLDSELQAKFIKDVEAASPVNEVSANHCMKSVSFGSRTFITYKGIRSPDLSCPGQKDPLAAALQKDLGAIMSQVNAVVPPQGRR